MPPVHYKTVVEYNRYPCIVSHLGENPYSVFPLYKILTRRLSNIYYYFKDVCNHLYFHEFSVRNGHWILPRSFSAFMENICFLFLNQIIWWIISKDFLILGYPYILSLNPTWLWHIIFIMEYQSLSAIFRNFPLVFISDTNL